MMIRMNNLTVETPYNRKMFGLSHTKQWYNQTMSETKTDLCRTALQLRYAGSVPALTEFVVSSGNAGRSAALPPLEEAPF